MRGTMMAGLASLLLGGMGFVATSEVDAGCRGGSCGSGGYYSYGRPSYSYGGCGPGGCNAYAPSYYNGSPSYQAYRSPNGYRPTYSYRPYTTYYRAPQRYAYNGRVSQATPRLANGARPPAAVTEQGAPRQAAPQAAAPAERFNPSSPAPERQGPTPPAAPAPDDNDQGRAPPPQKQSNQ
jgi:hypothetical protein